MSDARAFFARAREQGGALREAIVRGHGCCMINDPEFDQALWDEALAMHTRLVTFLQWIADPSYVGNYDDEQVVHIYRTWARNALEAE